MCIATSTTSGKKLLATSASIQQITTGAPSPKPISLFDVHHLEWPGVAMKLLNARTHESNVADHHAKPRSQYPEIIGDSEIIGDYLVWRGNQLMFSADFPEKWTTM